MIDNDNLQTILQQHEAWVAGHAGGKRADLRGANLWRANLSFADLRGANLWRANLQDADLRGACLAEANLQDADLRGACLVGECLVGAHLAGANLAGAYVQDVDIITFSLGKHFGFCHRGPQYPHGHYIKIGCVGGDIDTILDIYVTKGEGAGYTPAEIERYGSFLHWLKGELK